MVAVVRRSATALLVSALALGSTLFFAVPSASADPVLSLDWNVNASTHLKKLNMDVQVPQGKFYGVIDLGTGDLAGFLLLPPAEVKMQALGLLPLVDATFQIAPAFVSGHVDLSTLQVTTTSSFDINITKVTAAGLPANLVGDHCTTSKPVVVDIGGKADLTNGSTFTGTYTIPPLKSCGALTPALSAVMSGPGNTFTGTFTPSTPTT
jgi:hypothetical protein